MAELDPQPDPDVSAASMMERRGEIDDAVRRLHDAALFSTSGRRAELYIRAARTLSRAGRWDDALAEGYAAIAATPRDGWIYLEVAKILSQAGKRSAAIEMAREAASHDARVRFAAQDLRTQITAAGSGQALGLSGGALPWLPITAGLGVVAVAVTGLWVWQRRRRQLPTNQASPLVPAGTGFLGQRNQNPRYDDIPLLVVRGLGPGDFIGPYRIDRVVATSLHSTLYRAQDVRLRRQVAIKQANPMGMQSDVALSRFQKEVQSLIALSTYHDGVIKVFDYFPPGTLVTEWIDGENLDLLVGALPIDRVLQIGIELCDILSFAHSMEIVHRDIKPSNVMVTTRTHRVKLLDFGIAKNAGLGVSNLTVESDLPIGTFTYMAPEQFASPDQAQGASDVYSLGLTLYRVITGNLPATPWLGPRTFSLVSPDAFLPIDRSSVAVEILLDAVGDILPDLAWLGDLDRAIGHAFREMPGDRYPSAAKFKAELERVKSLVNFSVKRY